MKEEILHGGWAVPAELFLSFPGIEKHLSPGIVGEFVGIDYKGRSHGLSAWEMKDDIDRWHTRVLTPAEWQRLIVRFHRDSQRGDTREFILTKPPETKEERTYGGSSVESLKYLDLMCQQVRVLEEKNKDLEDSYRKLKDENVAMSLRLLSAQADLQNKAWEVTVGGSGCVPYSFRLPDPTGCDTLKLGVDKTDITIKRVP